MNWQDAVNYCKGKNKSFFQVRTTEEKQLIFAFFDRIPEKVAQYKKNVGIGWDYDSVDPKNNLYLRFSTGFQRRSPNTKRMSESDGTTTLWIQRTTYICVFRQDSREGRPIQKECRNRMGLRLCGSKEQQQSIVLRLYCH